MPFKRSPQKFNAAINAVTIGTGDSAITLGGENVLPLYAFDAAIENAPAVGVALSDLGPNMNLPGVAEFYAGADTLVEQAKKAASMPGANFLCIELDSADPNGKDAPVEDCVANCKAIADAVNIPLVIIGSGNHEKDTKLFEKVSEALQGKNILILSAKEENYKVIAASAGLAYGQKVGAESSVDINLAKQLNVLISQMGVKNETVVMNLGSAAAGYGFEYVASTMDRVKSAALGQNDQMLQMPIITPISADAWSVKEALVSEEDFPEWGPLEERGIDMEVTTATACLAAGSNAVILMHPVSVATVSKLISELM